MSVTINIHTHMHIYTNSNLQSITLYRVSKKVTPLRLLHIFLFAAILCKQKFTQLFTIHILTLYKF